MPREASAAAHRQRPAAADAADRPRTTSGPTTSSSTACANGQQLKCLTIVDEWTRECLAIDVAGSIRSERVIEVLARLVSIHGAPAFMRSDNGPEFVVNAILEVDRRRGHRDARSAIPASPGRTAPTRASTGSSATSA